MNYESYDCSFLENGGYSVGGAEVLLVVPLEHERARGATTPGSAPTAFDQLFANPARVKSTLVVELISNVFKIPANIFELDEVAFETKCPQVLANPERTADVSCAAEKELVATLEVPVVCIRAESTFQVCNSESHKIHSKKTVARRIG